MSAAEYTGKRILVADDEKAIRDSIADYLEDIGCIPQTAQDGIAVMEMFEGNDFDALIVDLNMPRMNGFAVIEKIVPMFPEMPVVVLSGVGVIDKAVEAIRMGAWDFLPKPIGRFSVLQITLERAFERSRLLRENRLYREHLEDEVIKKTEQVLELSRRIIITQKEIILRLGDVVETRSHETGNHVLRVSEYSFILGSILGMSSAELGDLRLASPMHDVGKIGIPDYLLNKASNLTDDEFEIMKTHTVLGYDIFRRSELPVLQLAADIALNHHEQWGGRGYPNGRSGRDIPLCARITSVVDVFDAITHPRVYKSAWDIDRSFNYIKDNSGIIFDPEIVDAFINNFDSILEIHNKM